MVKMLHTSSMDVVTFDSLESSFEGTVRFGILIRNDLADTEALEQLFSNHEFDAVMLFVSYIHVGQSVASLAKYYLNNVSDTLNLLNTLAKHGVIHFIFSSTAVIFGTPKHVTIDEEHAIFPINPYRRSL
jgi:UDP-glucose 4-epimerase